MGPDITPPSETFVNSAPRARPAASVHMSGGAFITRLVPRLRKFDPATERMLKFAPLKPPRDGSNDEVVSELETAASRGSPLAPTGRPLSVTLFWSAPRPST